MQSVDLYKPFINSRIGPAPLTLRVGVTPSNDMIAGGVQENAIKAETYVLISALPQELRERINMAVLALVSGR